MAMRFLGLLPQTVLTAPMGLRIFPTALISTPSAWTSTACTGALDTAEAAADQLAERMQSHFQARPRPSVFLESQSPTSCRPSHSQLSQLHQLRHLHGVPYSQLAGRPRPSPWPAINPVQGATSDSKLNRSVLRCPAGVTAEQNDNSLTLSGRAGSIKLTLSALDPTGLMAMKLLKVPAADKAAAAKSVLLLASPDEAVFKSVLQQLEAAVQGVMQGYLLGITVKGVGYRIEPVDGPLAKPQRHFELVPAPSLTTYPHKTPTTALRLKVGLPRPVIFPLPRNVRAFCVRPTMTYLYGLQLEELKHLASQIRDVRKPSPYTGNGILLMGEVLRTKQRAGRKGK